MSANHLSSIQWRASNRQGKPQASDYTPVRFVIIEKLSIHFQQTLSNKSIH